MKKRIFFAFLFCIPCCISFTVQAQNLPEIDSSVIDWADVRFETAETVADVAGYHLYIRKKDGIKTVSLIHDGRVIDQAFSPQPDAHYGESFHVFLPQAIANKANTQIILRTDDADSEILMGHGMLTSDVYDDDENAELELTLVKAPAVEPPAQASAPREQTKPAPPPSVKPKTNASAHSPIPSLIMGKGTVQPERLAAFLQRKNPRVSREYALLIAQIYVYECSVEGVNHDVAFAQMCQETAYLRFTGNVPQESNNFGALGAVSNYNSGNWFKTPQEGARAQIQHLKAYASTSPISGSIIDPHYRVLQELRYIGSAPTVKSLAGKWTADPSYGTKITNILTELYAN
ncbi:MAG: hypothetical protein Ta2A_09190 [Treponemataceae bacterium]|nr:MAG: hypothetical protein Ta2A_09190 [Treponemataceae bacterium]